MTLFKSPTAQEIWIEHWCDRCWQSFKNSGTHCPILVKALTSQRKPPQWDRRPREALIKDKIKCNEFATRPPVLRRQQQFDDVPMFEMQAHEANLIPVEGWPDKPRAKDTDHA